MFLSGGEATLSVGRGEPDVVRLGAGDSSNAAGRPHAVRNDGPGRLVPSIDRFLAGPPAAEPTWDSHVQAMCRTNGWDFESVRRGRIDGEVFVDRIGAAAADTRGGPE